MASVEELPPETGAHSEGFATPIGGGLPSESGDVVAHDLQEQFCGELLQLDEKYPGLGEACAFSLHFRHKSWLRIGPNAKLRCR